MALFRRGLRSISTVLDHAKTLFVVIHIFIARFVFAVAEVLDFLALITHFVETERC